MFEMNPVAGDGDGALDEVDLGWVRRDGVGFEKDDDVAALHGAVVHEGGPPGGRSKSDPVRDDVIADEQGVLHGAGGNAEVLEDEAKDEKTDDQDDAHGRERFQGCFFGA